MGLSCGNGKSALPKDCEFVVGCRAQPSVAELFQKDAEAVGVWGANDASPPLNSKKGDKGFRGIVLRRTKKRRMLPHLCKVSSGFARGEGPVCGNALMKGGPAANTEY